MPSFVQGAASHSYQPTVSGETCYHWPTQQKLIHTFQILAASGCFWVSWHEAWIEHHRHENSPASACRGLLPIMRTCAFPLSTCHCLFKLANISTVVSHFLLLRSQVSCCCFCCCCCFFFFWILGWHKHIFILPWFCWDPIESWSGDYWVPDDISRSHKQWEPRCLHKSWEKAGPELQLKLKQWTHSKSQDHAFVNVSWCCVFWV